MSARFSILASAVHWSLPLSRSFGLSGVAAATAATLAKDAPSAAAIRPQQRLRSLHSRNPTTSPLAQVGFPSPGSLDWNGGESEARNQAVRFYGENRVRGRELRQFFRSLRDMDPSVFLTARAVSSSRRGSTEAEEVNETSTPSSSPSTASEESLVGGRYCVLLTGHSSEYTQNVYGGYGQMFVEMLSDPFDKWDICAVVDGQLPAEEELEKYDGFVITGSKHDAHGSEEWIAKLCALLLSVHEKEKKRQSILGICFGHQVLARALGGKTGRTDVGWEIGVRGIQTTTALATKSYAVGVPPVFRIMESHQDQVQEIPPGGELLGFSERTPIEVFAVGDHVLGIQGHPEFTDDVLKDIIDTRLSLGLLTEEEAKDARATLMAGQPDREALVQLCKGFLKRNRS